MGDPNDMDYKCICKEDNMDDPLCEKEEAVAFHYNIRTRTSSQRVKHFDLEEFFKGTTLQTENHNIITDEVL